MSVQASRPLPFPTPSKLDRPVPTASPEVNAAAEQLAEAISAKLVNDAQGLLIALRSAPPGAWVKGRELRTGNTLHVNAAVAEANRALQGKGMTVVAAKDAIDLYVFTVVLDSGFDPS